MPVPTSFAGGGGVGIPSSPNVEEAPLVRLVWGYGTGGGISPCQDWIGLPPAPIGTEWGKQSSRAGTYYTTGGMPLAFTQEDFLIATSIQLQRSDFSKLQKKNPILQRSLRSVSGRH